MSGNRYVVRSSYDGGYVVYPWETLQNSEQSRDAFVFSDLDEAREQRDLFNAEDPDREFKVYRLVSREGERVPERPKS